MRQTTLHRCGVTLAFVLITPAIIPAQDLEAQAEGTQVAVPVGEVDLIQGSHHPVRAIKRRCGGFPRAQPQAVAQDSIQRRGRWARVRGGRPRIPAECID